jgi:IBR domain, a half RING-finger domain
MRFGSGCSPMNVLTASDSTRVLLTNMSPTVTHDDLGDIANSFGDVLNLTIDVGETYANAAIEYGDPTEALDAVTHLEGQTYDSLIITAGLDSLATEKTMHPLISRTVKVSWPSPSLSAWAFYATITIAKAQAKRLDGWTFNGRKIQAEFYRPRPKQTHSFAVKIAGLPPTKTTKKSLEQLCEENTLVTLETNTYDSTPVNNAIRDLLANLGPLDSFDVPSWDDNQSKVVGFAQFRMDATPLEGVMALHAAPQPFLGGGSLSLQQVFHAKYNLSARQSHAVCGEVDRLCSVHKPHGSVQFYEGSEQDKVVLHVYGDSQDREKFGQFNVELQALLQGDILMSEGKRVWDEYFAISSSAKVLENINANNSFFIQVDIRAQAIHVLGTEASRQAARAIVSRLLKKVRAQRCVIPLDRFSLHGLLTGGYQALQDDVGRHKVTLDVVASELIVLGDSDVVRQVRLALDTHASTSSNDISGPDLVEGGMSCPVCYRKPTNSIKLSCRHAYCQTCLQHVLQTSNGLRFTPPRCVAVMAGEENEEGQQCTEYIPYTLVRDLLRADEEEHLLKASFLNHVHNHPDDYVLCPTPNCETVYGRGREGVVYRCPSCSTQICSSCHLQHHEGLTCSERGEIRGVATT